MYIPLKKKQRGKPISFLQLALLKPAICFQKKQKEKIYKRSRRSHCSDHEAGNKPINGVTSLLQDETAKGAIVHGQKERNPEI